MIHQPDKTKFSWKHLYLHAPRLVRSEFETKTFCKTERKNFDIFEWKQSILLDAIFYIEIQNALNSVLTKRCTEMREWTQILYYITDVRSNLKLERYLSQEHTNGTFL